MTSPALTPPPPEDAAAGATGPERLRALAAPPLASPGARGPRLMRRVRSSERAIEDTYTRLASLPRASVDRSRAAEWLLDNHYVIQRAVRMLREEFPAGFERKLRLIAVGPARGQPMVYAVARELVAINQGRVDLDVLSGGVAELQTVRNFTIAELWALPAVVRLALLEELAVVSGSVVDIAAPDAGGREAEEESGRLIANAIHSLRALETADWKTFFERSSVVERILTGDPAGVYSAMDFDSRDRYRKAVERIAAGSAAADEEAVALAAVRLAAGGGEGRAGHVGHFLVDSGEPLLEREVASRPPWRERLRRAMTGHPGVTYIGAIAVLTLALIAALIAALSGTAPALRLAIAAGAALIPALSASVTLVNALLTRLLPPRVLPKLDFSRGVPPESRTLVAVPALLADGGDIDALLAELEIRYLANRDAEVQFALLTDLRDADAEHLEQDAALVQRAADGIAALNRRHGHGHLGPFHMLHRPRRWNAAEGVWMGWERKRGKLTQLNRWILRARAAGATVQPIEALSPTDGGDFELHVGDAAFLAGVRFVIVLDADTDLPRDSARQLAGALAHPLNRAEFAADNRVVAGYTILQPRVEINPLSAGASRFAALFAPGAGLDPYTRAVSDLYQDLFGEGSFVGKGIYDVAGVERSLAGVVPENALLSHDLFEGLHGRAALVSDSLLLEDYPAHYLGHTRRIDRWVRGDWQLLPWLGRSVPAEGGRRRNRLSFSARWRILDNLRRSLVAPALLLWLLVGWLLFPAHAGLWTLAAIAVLGLPAILAVVERLRGALIRLLRGPAAAPDGDSLRPVLAYWFYETVFLPHMAAVTLNAIARTLVRVYLTQRHLLQWTTAAHTARQLAKGNAAMRFVREMAAAPALALAAAALVPWPEPQLLAAAPLLLLWLAAPAFAHYLSQPPPRPAPALQPEDVLRLRLLARRTWAFFEAFVGPADQWLPPDHFQEDPRGAPARRTSPTNIGMLQLSILAAADFGYRGVLATALQLKNGFDTLDRLERFRGHFLNWYGTAALEPLEPRYVSTVDSGNLAGALLTVKQACLEMVQGPVVPPQVWSGYLDTLAVFADVVGSARLHDPHGLLRVIGQIDACVNETRATPARWRGTTARLLGELHPALERELMALLEPDAAPPLESAALGDLRAWLVNLKEHVERTQREMDLLMPWLDAWRRRPGAASDGGAATAAPEWRELEASVAVIPTVAGLPACIDRIRAAVARLRERLARSGDGGAGDVEQWAAQLDASLAGAATAAAYLRERLEETAARADAVVGGMDFSFLYDFARHLFFIGYNVSAARTDEHHYDLLASEARLASFCAIAAALVPEEHWVHLGRPIGQLGDTRALLSWSGTMFEYLMPALLIREGAETLIGRSCRAAVQEQIAYGRKHDVPWGISECGYYQFDAHLNYQYRAFGVPSLGFKRGLDEDLVVAPYASLLALRLAPVAVAENLRRLIAAGGMGRYGLYEAIDYTPSRRTPGEPPPVVRSFMAHHQGMVLAELNNFFHDDVLVRRFHAEPISKTAELLPYERPPRHAPVEQAQLERVATSRSRRRASAAPWTPPLDAPFPQVHVLSNGRTNVLATEVGGGASRWRDVALTRWSPDTTLDDDGFRIYLQEQSVPHLWTAFRDAGTEAGRRQVLFAPHFVEYHAHYDGLTARQRIMVVPDADVEIRQLTLTGEGRRRRVAVAGYGEVVLGDAAADRRHPAFSKLFVESEYLEREHALLFHRRRRTPSEPDLCLVHAMALPRGAGRPLGFDCARDTFIGRGRTARAPAALGEQPWHLAGSAGTTLDPIMALAATLDLAPHRPRHLAFITAVGETRDAALALARRYLDFDEMEWAFELAGQRAEDELTARGLTAADLPALSRLLSLLLYPHPLLRAAPDVLARSTGGRAALWRHGISGDLPILLVRVGHAPHAPLLPTLLRAQALWRHRGVAIDVVVLNEYGSTYDAHVDDQVMRAIADVGVQARIHRSGGIFPLQADQMSDVERTALLGAARAVIDGAADSLAEQLGGPIATPAALPPLVITRGDSDRAEPLPRPGDLLFDNGLGGFAADGSEYVIQLEHDQATPAPWVNVIANPACGFVVSERGGGYVWAANAGENRLTPWSNDAVSDEPGECLYIRDEESGAVWSPTPAPAWGGASYRVHHGVGYSRFEHRCRDIDQDLRLFVAATDAVKISELRLTNRSSRPRRLTVTYYVEWLLGTTRGASQPHLLPKFAPETETLTALNPWNDDSGGAVAFAAAGQRLHGFTADRTEFFGRHGDRARPAALTRIGLASSVHAGGDPCAALQVHVDLPPGESRSVHFLLGQGDSEPQALELVRRYRDAAAVSSAWDAVRRRWDTLLGARRVRTPEPALDVMLNRWLPYQTLSARIWGRTGFYQSSGAYGFRDQLQDVAAVIGLAPELCRAHLLEAAAHQFEDGDVLHWWHPPSGAGIRSRCSDDLLWLPFITAHYVDATGDRDVLAVAAPYLTGEPLAAHEAERYARFAPGPQSGTLYDHCLRALDRGGALGPHGLPLIGSGDWNDGMNLVGARGRGESIWLAWFLALTLDRFAPLCEAMHDPGRATEMRRRAEQLRAAVERSGWDGRWYRRGYYDDGSPLGSSQRDECRIDSLAQSWAVIAGAHDRRRARIAIDAMREHLVRERDRLILLLDPPFDRSAQEPGYIKGYPPGVRENGGQYTHAAVWAVWALAQSGDVDRAVRLFADILPVQRAATDDGAQRYRVEPYVVAADVYGGAHTGRGGWTWYTGAAGWAYRFGWEILLGLRPEGGGGWRIEPALPSTWPGCTICLRDGTTEYEIEIVQTPGGGGTVTSIQLDGHALPDNRIPRLQDSAIHRVVVTLT